MKKRNKSAKPLLFASEIFCICAFLLSILSFPLSIILFYAGLFGVAAYATEHFGIIEAFPA